MIYDALRDNVAVTLSRREHTAVLEESIAIDPSILALLRHGVVDGDRRRFYMTLADVEVFADGIAAEANHAKN